MTTVSVLEAKTHLSKLIAAVEAGEDVTITRNKVPVARIVPAKPQGKRQFGRYKGLIKLDDGFFDPLPEDELRAWNGE